MIVTFEGGSDDIVSTGIGPSIAKLERDETYVKSVSDGVDYARFEVRRPGTQHGISVLGLYSETGCWSFAYGPLDEDSPMPKWAFTVERAHDYSMRLVIDTVKDVVGLYVAEPEKEDDE